MSARTTPPYRADHVGSLLRPAELHAARDDFAAGRIDAARLRDVEDEWIRRIVAKQEEIGLQSATDGEFRRSSWHMDFIYALVSEDRLRHAELSVDVQRGRRELDLAVGSMDSRASWASSSARPRTASRIPRS